MSENGSGDRNGKKGERSDEEIESRQVNIGSKRYYIDIKQNARGRLLKIAEMGSNYKARLVFTMPAGIQLRDHLNEIIKFAETVPEGGDNAAENGILKTETLSYDSRRYYIDLRENDRGRFLRIAQTVSNPRIGRSQIHVPSTGIAQIRDVISELLDKHSAGFLTDLAATEAKAKQINAENKTFYFDVGSNDRGQFLRVSEVKNNSGYRSSITIPKSALESFQKNIAECLEELNAKKE